MSFVDNTAYRVFSNRINRHIDSYRDIQLKLRQSRIPLPVDQYMSSAYFYSILTGLIAGILGYKIGLYLSEKISLAAYFSINAIPENIIIASVSGIFLFLVGYYIVYFYYITVPSLRASVRKTDIDMTLPHSIAYLYAMSRGGGMNVFDIFKSLSTYSHVYGATASEIGHIVKDIEYFGHDLLTALHNASLRSPSDNFKDFIDGLITVFSSGGEITSYLKNKKDQYSNESVREQKLFLKNLGVLGEVYITVFVVGPLFLITILVVLGLMSPGTTPILYGLIYVIVPFGTVFYILLLESLINSGTTSRIDVVTKKLDVFKDIKVKSTSEYDRKFIRKIRFYKKLSDFKNTCLHPYRTFLEEPVKIFYITLPIAVSYLGYSLFTNLANITIPKLEEINLGRINVGIATAIDDTIFFAVLILLIPFIIFYELRRKRIEQIEDEIPEFLKRLANINEAGIQLVDAIAMTLQSNIGVLHSEVKRMVEDISWGSNLADTFRKFEYRIGTDMTSRIITLLVKANESTSDIKSVLNITATDAKIQKQLKKDRFAEMFVYVFIIYTAFFVFLFIVYVLGTQFLSNIPATPDEASAGLPLMSGFDKGEYIMLFFHAAMIQGFGSGLVAGKMGAGSIASGLKHSVIMMVVSYFVFTTLI